jgi:predicted AAA+ superfamily ATPase
VQELTDTPEYLRRSLEAVVREVTRQYPVVLLTGPRQVGKTTMLKHLSEGTGRDYVSLDDLETRQSARTNPRLFLETHPPPLLIDEIQYAPELFTYLKINVDQRQQPGDYWLTGSQLFKLMRGVQESLAGRIAHIRMSTLTRSEICGLPEVPFCVEEGFLLERHESRPVLSDRELFESILRGAMPRLVANSEMRPSVFYSSYLSSYLQRDIRNLAPATDEFKFLDFMRSAAIRCGQTVNYAAIARDAGVSEKTIKAWLTLLETLGIIFYLHPYSNNMLTRAIKAPKLYFFDTGLVAHLARISDAHELQDGVFGGPLLENYVVNEIWKSYLNYGQEPDIYYYRDVQQREIDILLRGAESLTPIEVKRSSNPGLKAISAFSALDAVAGLRAPGAVVCLSQKLGSLTDKDYIVPVSLI